MPFPNQPAEAERSADAEALARELSETRREMLRRLEESETRFRAIAEAAPVGILISRVADGIIVYVNPKLSEMYGLTPDLFLGRSTLDFYVDSKDRELLLRRLANNEVIEDFELETHRANGSVIWLSVSARRMAFDGEPCLLSVLLDITERKLADIALQRERRRLRRLLEVQEQERRLVAYEIHDGLVQELTAIALFLDAIGPAATTPPERIDESVKRCRDAMRIAINEARRVMNGLRAPVLEQEGLIAGIGNLIEEVIGRSGLSIKFEHCEGVGRMTPGVETSLYRIVQESLNNIWKHSRSANALVRVELTNENLAILIQDWGVGFDPANAQRKGHFGLEGMRERTRILDGVLNIESRPGEGTCVRLTVPIASLQMKMDGLDHTIA